MFRAAASGPFDEVVARATDENLTSEDWGAIMEVCDRVSTEQNGPREVTQSLIKRLAHRNANVQLYTLELANALSQNCGKNLHQELSSRAFTDALLKLGNDRNTHNQVKAKILERMGGWTDMFQSDPDLGIMADAFHRLKQNNPTIQPPSAPQKDNLTDVDRQKEDDELQMALKLSLQEEERKKQASEPGSSGPGAAGPGSGAGQAAAPTQPMPSGTTAATVSRVRALYDFVPSEPGELEFKKGDVIAVLESVYKDWWRGSLKGKTGIFPLNYVEKLTDPTPDELQREAQMEAEVFAEIKNVEKLLTLLSASNTAPREEDNEEISKLYHQTLAIRPKLIKLIEKYSQKKDDFTQLNEKFIKARRDYEALLESSMSHPPGPSYHTYAMPAQSYPPPGPAGPPGGPAYLPQTAPQDPQRFFTPAPPQEHRQQPPSQYPPSSPPPNMRRPNQAPAPFYMAGTEIPAQGGAPPQAQPPAQPAGQSQYRSSDRLQHHPPIENQPAPDQASVSPPAAAPYASYQAPAAGQRAQSIYGPQELSTSVYDSPIAPHNPGGDAGAYHSPAQSPQSPPYGGAGGGGGRPPVPAAAAPPIPPSQSPGDQRQNYQPYAGYQMPPQRPYGHEYEHDDAAGDDTAAYPRASVGTAPQPSDASGLTPAPLQVGAAYDARQTLPSRAHAASPPPPPTDAQPQYKAYVPPGPAAPGEASGGEAPSAPADYYRTAAY